MIEIIDGLPKHVLAIRATGLVSGEDYRNIVRPAVEARRTANKKLCLLYHFPPAFRKFTTTALWDDTQIGLHRLTGFARVAVVTDIEWLRTLVNGLRPAEAIETRAFADDGFDEARDWIGGST